MEWPNPANVFTVEPVSPWAAVKQQEPVKPDFADDNTLKQAYGIALGKALKPFEAGLEIFPSETSKALWVSVNWVGDPVVIAAKDAYAQTFKKLQKPLDKEELLEEVLTSARQCEEDKDRVAFLKLYSDIAGYTGKALIDASTINNNTNVDNTVKIVLVSGSERDMPKTINNSPNIQSKMLNDELPPLKLVGGTSR